MKITLTLTKNINGLPTDKSISLSLWQVVVYEIASAVLFLLIGKVL